MDGLQDRLLIVSLRAAGVPVTAAPGSEAVSGNFMA
jgi:hypothetical protein